MVGCILCQRGSDFDNVFLVDERRDDQNTTKSVPSSARQQNAIKWHFADILLMA